MPEIAETEATIVSALGTGYRLIDTAAYYRNEASVGRAVREYMARDSATREDIFVTTKIWPSDFGFPEKAFMRSLERLDLQYIDLYLIHWPSADLPKAVWRILERMHEQKLTRAIGVSNFDLSDIESLRSYANTPPAVNQIKFSVFDHDLKLLEYCTHHNIVVEAYSPLERGRLDNPTVRSIAAAHRKTPAQVMLRWCLEHGTIPIPKSSRPNRQKENLDVFDFVLTETEMSELDALG
jgi:diketogulonate reductase-like aldo/keto reductase